MAIDSQTYRRRKGITREELGTALHLPLAQAAKQFNMCTAKLKKVCREYGVRRWPFRKILSAQRYLEAKQRGQELSATSQEDSLRVTQELRLLRDTAFAGTPCAILDRLLVEQLPLQHIQEYARSSCTSRESGSSLRSAEADSSRSTSSLLHSAPFSSSSISSFNSNQPIVDMYTGPNPMAAFPTTLPIGFPNAMYPQVKVPNMEQKPASFPQATQQTSSNTGTLSDAELFQLQTHFHEFGRCLAAKGP